MAERGYASPAAFRRALTDRLKNAAQPGRWTLPQLQRQMAYDRLLERLYLVDQEWIIKGATALLARNIAFDGIVAASDVIALAALQVLGAQGLAIPRQVAVVGFDDVGLAAHTQPALTTVRQEIRTGAQLLTKALLTKIEGGAPRSSQIAPMLVVRDSS